MTVALLIFMIGLNCSVLCNNVKTENLADINYEYMYLLKYPTEQVPEGAEPCLVKNLSVNYLDYSLDAWKTGASGFIIKPITVAEVRKQLSRLRYSLGGIKQNE
jgi:hypothetical protein